MPDEVYDDSSAVPTGPLPYNQTQGYYEQEKLAMVGSGLSLGNLRNPPVRKILEQQIAELKAQVKEREDLLADLDKEPGIEKILDRMRKLHL